MVSAQQLYSPAVFDPLFFKDYLSELANKFGIDGILRMDCIMFIKYFSKDKFVFLTDTNQVITLASNDLNIINSDPVLVQHGIVMAKLNNRSMFNIACNYKDFNEFCFSIIKKQHQWLSNTFVVINQYLSKRVASDAVLTSQAIIRVELAEVLEGIYIISALLKQNNNSDLNQALGIANLIAQAAKKLAACAGGRAFTGGNVLEFYWFSILLQQFLWGDL
jgi:hypothetical protein